MRRFFGTRMGLIAIMAASIMVITALNVTASDTFTDVPNTNQFHDDIGWMADQGITSGCGGGKYCPSSSVTRGQMAAFMHNLATVQVVSGADIAANGAVSRWFEHVTETIPTVTHTGGTGVYDIDVGWNTTDAYAVCSVDNNAVATRDAICSTQMLGAGGVRVRIFDTGDAAEAEADFMVLVYGLDM